MKDNTSLRPRLNATIMIVDDSQVISYHAAACGNLN